MAHATTVNPAGLAGVLREQLEALRQHLPRAVHGHAGGVHRARVASRRLREVLPVAAIVEDRSGLRRDVRRVTKALGRVREIDVALAEFDRRASTANWNSVIVQRIADHLDTERAYREREMKARLDAVNVKRIDERVSALAEAITDRPSAAWQRLLSGRLRRRARAFGGALEAVGTLYAIEPLHKLRIAGKKLRYTLELARQASGAPVAREIAALKRVQDQLGRMRDLQIVLEQIHHVEARVRDLALNRSFETPEKAFEAECRDLHAQFLRRRARLIELAGRVARQAAAELVVRRPARVSHLRPQTVRRNVRAVPA
jgi:CHAD domain-containing protein